MKFRLLSWSITLVSTLTGLLALLYPFFLPSVAGLGYGGLRSGEMPLMMTLLLGLCLLVLLVEAQGRAADARLVALLGVLVAINSALRFLETAIPGPGGFSPIFFLILLAGYVYGGRFGFLTGALTLLVSALITGGVGPWLPGQMFTAGWLGLSAPLIRPLGAWLRGRPAPKARIQEETISAYPPPPRLWGEQREAWLLACFGALWGFLFGALMNLWSWPFIAGPAGQAWAAGIGLAETLRRYAAYYLLTSLAWDAMAAAGNFLLLAAFGAPALRALRRFRQRFDYYYLPTPHPAGGQEPPTLHPAPQGAGEKIAKMGELRGKATQLTHFGEESSPSQREGEDDGLRPSPGGPGGHAMIHTAAWLIWLAAALAALSATRNPLYLLLFWLCMLVVGAVLQRRSDASAAPFSLLRFSAVVIALAALFNAFTSHMGESVLLTIPGRLPLLSGPVTWEGLIYGAINGLALAGLLAAFGVLNRAVPVRALVRLIPRAFYPVAVVTAIAVTYVPVTVRQFRQVREAQAVRGHRLRGLRGWLPLLMPLLVGGLERALALAEAMTARGFASQPQSPGSSHARLALLGGVVCLAGGWMLLFSGAPALLHRGLILAGVLLIGAGLWALGRRWPRTTYRHEPWRASDTLVCLGALLALAAFLLPLPGLERASLAYSPYPRLALPGFDLRLAALALGLLVPALVGRRQ